MKKVLLWGGTGQAKIVRPILEQQGYEVSVVIDDTPNLQSPFPDVEIKQGEHGFFEYMKSLTQKDRNFFTSIRGEEGLYMAENQELYFVVTIGNDKTGKHARARRAISEFLIKHGLKPISVIHPTAFIDKNVKLGIGVQILAGAKVMVNATIGDWCIINTNASVDHDCILGEGVEVAPHGALNGEIRVGENSFIGSNAVILPKTKIGSCSVVGAGSVVVKDVVDGIVVVGNPARPLCRVEDYDEKKNNGWSFNH